MFAIQQFIRTKHFLETYLALLIFTFSFDVQNYFFYLIKSCNIGSNFDFSVRKYDLIGEELFIFIFAD